MLSLPNIETFAKKKKYYGIKASNLSGFKDRLDILRFKTNPFFLIFINLLITPRIRP